jgi:hypothetical protein
MAAGATYEPIATTTISGTSTNSYTFSSIPSTYTDLVLVVSGSTVSTNGVLSQVNGDTGTNYSATFLYGDGSSAASIRNSNEVSLSTGYFDTSNSNMIIHYMNYKNTTTYKTVLSRSNASGSFLGARASLWRNTAAITSIKIFGSGTNLGDATTLTLYGIAAA